MATIEQRFLCADSGWRTFYFLEEIMKRIVCLLLAIVALLSSCSPSFSTGRGNHDDEKENKVVEMFIEHADYDPEGNMYIFTKTEDNIRGMHLFYQFAYSPSSKIFYCSAAASEIPTFLESTNGAIFFSWGNVKNGLFSGSHKIEYRGKIEFEYSNNQLLENTTLGNGYLYDVVSNSFSNLKSESDIQASADACYKYVRAGVAYAQSILFQYLGSSYTLW